MRFFPVDEATSDPELMAVRGAIVRFLSEGRFDALGRYLANELSDGLPAAELVKALGAVQSEWKRDLMEALTGGGVFVDVARDKFCGPYWHARKIDLVALPQRLISEDSPWIVIEPDVAVLAERRRDARRIGTVGLELVRVDPAPGDQYGELMGIRFNAGRAYVETWALRDPDEPLHACFTRQNGMWKLNEFSTSVL